MPKPARAAHGLTVRAEKFIQRLTGFAVLTLAVSAAILSFSGLQKLAVDSGFDPNIAWLLPVIVDGMVLTGSLGVIAAGLVGLRTWYEWMLTILGVAISVAGNIASAPATLTAQLVHAIAPITFALSIEGMLRIYRASAAAQAQREAAQLAADERKTEREARAAERASQRQAAPKPVIQPVTAPAAVKAPAVSAPTVSSASEPRAVTVGEGTARDRINTYLQNNPNATAAQVARDLAIDPSYTRKIFRTMREEQGVEETLIEYAEAPQPQEAFPASEEQQTI